MESFWCAEETSDREGRRIFLLQDTSRMLPWASPTRPTSSFFSLSVTCMSELLGVIQLKSSLHSTSLRFLKSSRWTVLSVQASTLRSGWHSAMGTGTLTRWVMREIMGLALRQDSPDSWDEIEIHDIGGLEHAQEAFKTCRRLKICPLLLPTFGWYRY
jgi:hypothetical protein